jgi:hypothetical protein
MVVSREPLSHPDPENSSPSPRQLVSLGSVQDKGLSVRSPGVLSTLVSGKGGLSPATQKALVVAQRAGDAFLKKHCDSLDGSGTNVIVATDYSASTKDLVRILEKISIGLASRVAKDFPQSTVNFGVFGGGGLIAVDRSKSILARKNIGTYSWNSTFNDFLTQIVGGHLDRRRKNFLITFHDAAPGEAGLQDAVKALNEADVTVVVCYVPSCGSTNDDKTYLESMVNSETGIKKGVFVDMSEIDYLDPEVLQIFIARLIDLLEKTNDSENTDSSDSTEVDATRAHSRFKLLVSGLSRKLAGRKKCLGGGGRKLLR